MKKFVALLTAGAMALSLAACGGGSSSSSSSSSAGGSSSAASADTSAAEAGPATEVTVINGDPASFSPLNMLGGGKNPLSEVYESLIDQDGFAGEIYGVLAKEWHWEGDDLYAEIYDNIYDSAGNHITADDVVFSYNESLAQGYNSAASFGTYCDGNMEALSDTEVVFHFLPEQSDAFNAQWTILSGQYIFSQKAYEESSDQMSTNPIGTGPYVVTSFVSGSNCVLEKNENYWQTDESLIGPQHKANIDKITYEFVTDATQQINALQSGAADYLDGISETGKNDFESREGWAVGTQWSRNCLGLLPNCLEGMPLNDINLRAALFWAIDVDAIIDVIGGPDYARRTYYWGILDTDLYNEEWETLDNYETKDAADLDKAQEFMAQSSYNGETLRIIYNVDGSYASVIEPMALMVGEACDKLGISYNIENVSDDIFQATTQADAGTDWDIMIWSQGSDGDLLKFYKNNFNTKVYKGGLGNWYDETLDELVATANSQSGATRENIDNLIDYVIDNYYAYGFLEPTSFYVYNTNKIVNADTRTYRSWVLPGAWEFVK